MITFDGVCKAFGKNLALDCLDVQLPGGEIVGVVGPDGAGKTTLMRLLAGILEPTKGKITVAGLDTVSQQKELHEIIGYMPQKFGLYEDITVQQNLTLYADLKGIVGEEREKTFAELLRFTTLGPFVDRLAGKLSGGMKQKLGLACALLGKPKVLLLDEPSVGVDPISRRELWTMVGELASEGVLVLWSTAYLDEAEKCAHVLLLDEGKLLYQGLPGEMTGRVEGRVYSITGIEGARRTVLENALMHDEVMDGTIQGANVRLVMQKNGEPAFTPEELGAGKNARWEESEPRFEDAFIDILGGGPKGRSPLAERMEPLPLSHKAVVKASHLTKKFGAFTAAHDISFSIQPGEIFGLLGPNGAGKTTTFKMLCGLLTPTSGRSAVYGADLQEAKGAARMHIGYMAQKFSLYGSLTVLQNLRFFSGVYNLQKQRQAKTIDTMVEIFGLEPHLSDTADQLPLGFKQRLALSCAVMHEPEVLFLDEPTSGVDPITRREFWNHINGLVQKGVTVVATTHFMDEAEYCDRIGLVNRSELIKVGSPDELKKGVATPENPTPTLEDAFVEWVGRHA